MATTRDNGGARWRLNDDVLRLREWATSQSRALPESTARELTVGSAKNAWLRLQDSKGRVSKQHGALYRKDGKWVLRDSGSTNGILVGGQRYPQLVLEPAQEINIGGVTMIAESHLSMALHGYLSRILGWGNIRAVDLALRTLRVAAMREAALVLCGSDDLISIAHSLHYRVLGPERPFVYCAQTRADAEHVDNALISKGITLAKNGMLGLREARNGSLCLSANRLPADYLDVIRAFPDPDTRVMLIICAKRTVSVPGGVPIEIPSLSSREREVSRIITEYAADAAANLGLEPQEFPPEYEDWIIAKHAKTLSQIERATERLLALREARSAYGASKLVGIAKQSMAAWIRQHGLPASLASAND